MVAPSVIANTNRPIVHIMIQDYNIYCQNSNISRILVGNKLVDHSDAVGASPVDAAPTPSSFST